MGLVCLLITSREGRCFLGSNLLTPVGSDRSTARSQGLIISTVCVDTVDKKSIVSIQPKPAFQPLFEIAKTRKGGDFVQQKQDAPGSLALWSV